MCVCVCVCVCVCHTHTHCSFGYLCCAEAGLGKVYACGLELSVRLIGDFYFKFTLPSIRRFLINRLPDLVCNFKAGF